MSSLEAMRDRVCKYLTDECGVFENRVEDLLNKGQALIEHGVKLRSLPYYVGDEILERYAVDDDYDQDFVPPEDIEDEYDEEGFWD